MAWKQLELTPPHLAYSVFSIFLICYALFSVSIRNRLHLSEPPLALLFGIVFGPQGIGILQFKSWGFGDSFLQEFSRIILGLQVFTVGIELPRYYFKKNWKSLLYLLVPVMTFGWIVCALFIALIFKVDISSALIISVCLTPTDPVLASSVLTNSHFSTRVPKRIKNLLSCESGCNDGASYPFLYLGLVFLSSSSGTSAVKEWFLVTILYQCMLGILIGIIIGRILNFVVRQCCERDLIGPESFLAFYVLLSILSIGVASMLGLDDFLVAFCAGASFSHDGWFAFRTKQSHLNNILDLLLNSTFFIFLGAILPWNTYIPRDITPTISPGKLIGLFILVLFLRRIPVLLALKNLIPGLRTYSEALFVGHFGPMGVGAVFLAIEAQAQMETSTSVPVSKPDPHNPNAEQIALVWPIVSFIVLGSTIVHGLSVAATSIMVHFSRDKKDRHRIPGSESEPMPGMQHEDYEDDSSDVSDQDHWQGSNCGRIQLPTA